MAREVSDIAYEVGFLPIFVARDQAEMDAWSFPAEIILEADVSRYHNLPFVIGIGENQTRKRLAQRYSKELKFLSLIHPSATFGRGQRQIIEARQGVIIGAGVRFTNQIQVGDFCIFNQNVTIAHDVIVEDFVHVAPGSVISGNVHIGRFCWIGAGAVVNQGSSMLKLHIGESTFIGSGSVVIKSCEPNGTYVGVPARKIE